MVKTEFHLWALLHRDVTLFTYSKNAILIVKRALDESLVLILLVTLQKRSAYTLSYLTLKKKKHVFRRKKVLNSFKKRKRPQEKEKILF